jgi:uncharacterized protein (TIGR00369 family)
VSQTREQRLQARLHDLMPLYGYIGLELLELVPQVRCRVPLNQRTRNHFGAMHAGVLFTAGEAAAGLAVTQNRDFAALTLIATRITIAYQRPARGDVQAVAALSEEALRAVREGIARDPRHTFEVTVDLKSEEGELLAQCACAFQLRAPR